MPQPGAGFRTSLSVQARFVSGQSSGQGFFSPGAPLTPPDPQPTRVFDFAVGRNRVYTPRYGEPFGFAHLRAFANVEPVRLAIETRKDQIERLGWRVRSKDEKKPKPGHEERIKLATSFLTKPDGVNDFSGWTRAVLEDHFVLDAVALERRRSMGGKLIGLDLVQGDTITLLVDEQGRRPIAPAPAYQQVIKGRIWCDLTTDDLIYARRNMRSNHLYGFGPVEQIIVTINTVLNRQARQLAYFTDGNTPPGVMTAPEGWSPDHIKQYQEWFDEVLKGNNERRAGLVWGPFGAKYWPFKDPPLKDDFDEWLYRVVCFAFNLPPTPFIKQMNRSTADADADRAMEEGREPTMLWLKRLLDPVIQSDLGFEDLEFDWVVPRDIDPKVQAEIDDTNVRNGTRTIDEVRDARGEQPLPNGAGAHALVYTKDGVVRLEDALNRSANAEPAPTGRTTAQEPETADE